MGVLKYNQYDQKRDIYLIKEHVTISYIFSLLLKLCPEM